ncbi:MULTISPECIES: hypothetical protein [unclassified Moorena]|uniref:hypothetical protein n=1 Tax=unclassified Moorena TaxID=2683338 RepID=UPI0025E92743|nr:MULTISPECIES: hypothetical protein [unclassified Moorena]
MNPNCPIPYSLFPTPYSLLPIPYSLFPVPYSLPYKYDIPLQFPWPNHISLSS